MSLRLDSRELKPKIPPPQPEVKKGPPPKMKRVKRKKLKANKVQKSLSVDKMTGTVEEDEDCSATKCLKPSGNLQIIL